MEIMDKVWIVTSEIKNDGRVIEGVFNSYKLARVAAEDIWRKIEPHVILIFGSTRKLGRITTVLCQFGILIKILMKKNITLLSKCSLSLYGIEWRGHSLEIRCLTSKM